MRNNCLMGVGASSWDVENALEPDRSGSCITF